MEIPLCYALDPMAGTIVLSLALALAVVSRLVIDVDGDGRADTIELISGRNDVTVVVHFGDTRRMPERFHFPVDPGREDAVCKLPVHLRVEHSGFAVVDGVCDSIHFVWNRKTQRLEWSRL
jgi:hypothetical protein